MAAALLVLSGCFQIARRDETTTSAGPPTFTGDPKPFEGTYDVGVTRGTPGPNPLKAQNCISLRTTSATRIVSGSVTATWSPTGPASERLGLYVHFERRPAGLLDAEGPSPLALVLSGFESPDPSDRLFLFVEFPPGDFSAGAQAVRLTVDFEYLGGEIEPEGPKVCNVPSEP